MSASRILIATDQPRFPERRFWKAVAATGTQVEVVAMVGADERWTRAEVAPNYVATCVPRRPYHESLRDQALSRAGTTPQELLGQLYHYTPEYGDALVSAAATASLVVADGAAAAGPLVRYTSQPLILDACDAITDVPGAADIPGRSSLRRAFRAAYGVRAHSERQAAALVAAGCPPGRLITVPDSADTVRFVPLGERRAYQRAYGLMEHPVVLAFHTPAQRDRLEALARNASVRLIGGAAPDDFHELLALAAAAVLIDDGPSPRGELLTYAAAGVPLIAQVGPLVDAGLDPAQATVFATWEELADRLAALGDAAEGSVEIEADARVNAARNAVAGRTHDRSAQLFLGAGRVAAMLDWNRTRLTQTDTTTTKGAARV